MSAGATSFESGDLDAALGDLGIPSSQLRASGGTLDGVKYNPVRASVKLNRRGDGYTKLFQPKDVLGSGSDEDEPVYEGKHDRLTQQFTRISELPRDERTNVQEQNRALFEAQKLKRDRHAGRGGGGQLFGRTQSAPDAVAPGAQAAGGPSGAAAFRRRQTAYDVPSAGKDQLRTPQDGGKGKSLRRRQTAGVFAGGHAKSAHDRYHEMAMPWMAMLDADGHPKTRATKQSPKSGSDDEFSDNSSDAASPAQGFSRTQSAPSPSRESNEAATARVTKDSALSADSHFARTRSAPESGYVQDDFSRLPSNASVATYQSSDPADFEIVPAAQMQQIFMRSQSAPGLPQGLPEHEEGDTSMSISRTRSSGSEPDARTPRSARSGRSPRTPKGGGAKKPLQSAEEAAQELMGKGLRCDWTSNNAMPFCVAEQLAERLNWDAAFAESMPGEKPRGGIYTTKFLQDDFRNFLERRDVMVINLATEMEAASASHILRFFTTNEGMAKLKKRGSVQKVVEGNRVESNDPSLPQVAQEILDASYPSCREIFLSGGISVLENILHPAEQMEETYEVYSAQTAGFCVFRHLHAKLGKTLMYKHMKYRHYCGWIMVHRRDQRAKTTYKVQYVSAFSASLIKRQVMNALPYVIRPQKNFSTTILYYMLLDKFERNFQAVATECGKGTRGLGNLALSIGKGKHLR